MANKNLVKKLYLHSDMIAAGVWANINKADQLDEITLSLAHKEGGCEWEFGIELILLQKDKASMRVRVYNDAWRAFQEAPEIFQVLGKFNAPSDQDDRVVWPKLIAALEEVGWKKVKPEPREFPKPVVCESCGRP